MKTDYSELPIMERFGEGPTARVACQLSTKHGQLMLPEPATARNYDDGLMVAFTFADGSEMSCIINSKGLHCFWSEPVDHLEDDALTENDLS